MELWFEHLGIKCPKCGGRVNSMRFLHLKKGYEVYVAECWSGNLKKKSYYHRFLVKIKLLSEIVVINQEGETVKTT